MSSARDLILTLKQRSKCQSQNGYGLQQECEDFVTYVMQNMVKTQIPQLIEDVKNDQESIRYREQGNRYYIRGDDFAAVEQYTRSLAYAASDSLISLAHANRSAALYRKQFYRECIVDINASLSYSYPEEKKKKLEKRANDAMEFLKSYSDDRHQLICNDPTPFSWKKTEENMKQNMPAIVDFVCDKSSFSLKKKTGEPHTEEVHISKDRQICILQELNKEAFALNSGININYSEQFGRHLVATRSFRAGDILSVEEPFSQILFRERYYTHCHNCQSMSFNLIPCSKCPLSLYCSEECRNQSWEIAHQFECSVQSVLSNLFNVNKNKIRLLSKIIRMIIIATKGGTKIYELMQDTSFAEINPDKRTAGFTEHGTFVSQSARSVLSLATNMSSRPITEISTFACISSLATILLATKTTFFGKRFCLDKLEDILHRKDIIFSGAILFRFCTIVSSNSFSIQQNAGSASGSGLYVAHSLYNHSCAPNTFRHFEGLQMVSRALVPIYSGEQIFTCYGGGYQLLPRLERQKKMMDEYFFQCCCTACSEDWPMYSEIIKNHVGSVAKLNAELYDRIQPLNLRLLKNKYDIGAVKEVLDILCAKVKMPCEEVIYATQYLKSFYFGKFI